MSSELVKMHDRTRSKDTMTLERSVNGVALVLERPEHPGDAYWRFLVPEEALWPLAIALTQLAKEADRAEVEVPA